GRGLRTPGWTYAVAAPKRRGWRPVPSSEEYVEYMLYDLAADPHQHVNLAGRAETLQVSEALRRRLIERIVEAGGARPTIEPPFFPYPCGAVQRSSSGTGGKWGPLATAPL